MHRLEVIHVLIDEFRNGDLRQVAVRLVADEPHRENVAQGRSNEVRILADKKLQTTGEVFVCGFVIHEEFVLLTLLYRSLVKVAKLSELAYSNSV